MKFISTLATVALFVSFSPLNAAQYIVNPETSKVEFLAKGSPGFLKIQGKEGKAKGDLTVEGDLLTGSLTSDMSLFVTGIELRDKHMKETYLEVAKYPTATLKFTKQPIKLTETGAQTLKAELTLHGVTKPVTIEAKLKSVSDKKINVSSELKVMLSDYGIDIPKYLGVTVAQDVAITTVLDAEIASKP